MIGDTSWYWLTCDTWRLFMVVGMNLLCMVYVFTSWLIIYVGKWSVHNPLESLGEASRSCFNGRDVVPWPLLVGAYGGAPSVRSGKDSR